jgi:plastocyanin
MVPSSVADCPITTTRACHRDDRDACQVAGNGIVLQPKPGSDRTLSDSLRLIVASGPSRGSAAGSRTSAMTGRTASFERARKPTPHTGHGVRYGLNAVKQSHLNSSRVGTLAYRVRKGFSTLVGAFVMFAVACGSDSGRTATSPSPTPAPGPAPVPPRVTITSKGVDPASITVAVGTRVTFVNNDTIPHDVAGGPDPFHPDCPQIDAVGFLTPGQSRQTDPLPQARTCEYHDHAFHSTLFNGRIVIQ